MAIIRVFNWQEGGTFHSDRIDDWAASRRESYTPYQLANSKWRIQHKSSSIDEDGNLEDEDDINEGCDMTIDGNHPLAARVIAEFSTEKEAVALIKKIQGKSGVRQGSREERQYEKESEAEIRRLVEKD